MCSSDLSGKRLAIFSVWDPTSGDDPSKVDPAKRVKLVEKGPKTRVGRFGGEGTGGQSFIDDLPWKEGQEVRFLLRAKALPEEKRTAYSAWVAMPGGPWQHIATFSTQSDGRLLKGYYAFVEDFKFDDSLSWHCASQAPSYRLYLRQLRHCAPPR